MSEEHDDKLRHFVRWDSNDPMDVVNQLAERVRQAKKEGKTCGVVTCFVWIEDLPEPGNCYDVGFSPLPVEVVAWAGEKIRYKAFEK